MTETAASRWRAALEARAIPQAILDASPESPWGFPAELFKTRAEKANRSRAVTPTTERALDALPEAGTVLDVGVGGGATSLPLASRASRIVGVDQQADMLATFERAARARGVEPIAIEGRWPDVAPESPRTDVVVSGHTIYNVPDLDSFATALTRHAVRRVVLEATDRHPLGWMSDLWRHFHGLDIADQPSIELAIEVILEAGIEPSTQVRSGSDDEPSSGGFTTREGAIALVRKRLCLHSDRDAELSEVLGSRVREREGLWTAAPLERTVVTLWWNTTVTHPPGADGDHRP